MAIHGCSSCQCTGAYVGISCRSGDASMVLLTRSWNESRHRRPARRPHLWESVRMRSSRTLLMECCQSGRQEREINDSSKEKQKPEAKVRLIGDVRDIDLTFRKRGCGAAGNVKRPVSAYCGFGTWAAIACSHPPKRQETAISLIRGGIPCGQICTSTYNDFSGPLQSLTLLNASCRSRGPRGDINPVATND